MIETRWQDSDLLTYTDYLPCKLGMKIKSEKSDILVQCIFTSGGNTTII